jgi:TetR/AcrR family transcriptional regulator, regulator of autoinduction and epiphytic fitness
MPSQRRSGPPSRALTVAASAQALVAPRRGRPPKGAQVLDAAVEVFLRNGYANATLEQIAREAEVSTATVFKHYRTKADIFGAIMSRVFGEAGVKTFVQPPVGEPRQGLLTLGRLYAGILRQPRIRSLFRVVTAEVPRFPELGVQLYEQGKKPYLAMVEGYLRAEVDAGTLAMPDITLATRQFLGMINDVVFWPYLLVENLPDDDREAARVIEAAAETIVRAYAADAAAVDPARPSPTTVGASHRGAPEPRADRLPR